MTSSLPKLRMTRQRRVILEELSKLRTHPTADELYKLVRRRLPHISLATVYRNLEILSEASLIKRIELSGPQMRFDPETKNHYHIRCMKCGRLDDMPGDVVIDLEERYESLTDYEITGCRVEFIGICPKCAKRGTGSRRMKTGGGVRPSRTIHTGLFDSLYDKYNHREFVHPDPLEFLYPYEDIRDREIVALIASSLAYGRVAQILKSVSNALERMPDPYAFLMRSSKAKLRHAFEGFKHRFTTGEELASLLHGAKRVIKRHGSLQACFTEGLRDDHETITPALDKFANALAEESGLEHSHLIPSPSKGSACKRLNLFLRWMIRQDEVDPGGWYNVPPRKLVVPVDTHMHRIGLALGMTGRKQADRKAATEITNAFKLIAPEDPVRYDFALTRPGIRREGNVQALFSDFR